MHYLEKELNEQFSRIGINRRLDEYAIARGQGAFETEDTDSTQQQQQFDYEQQQATVEYNVSNISEDAFDNDQQNPDDTDDS